MDAHAKLWRAAAIAITAVTLLVAGRVISRGLTPPSSPSTTVVAATATSSAPSTTPPPSTAPPVPQPRRGRLVATRAARTGWLTYVDKVDHLSVTIPAGWSAKSDPIRQLAYPDPILAVGSWPFPIDSDHSCAPVRALRAMPADGVLLWVLESRPTTDTGLFDPQAFPPRPRSFDLRTLNRTNASCTDQPGYVVRFQDAGRNFGVEIVFGAKAPPSHRTVVEQVLQSLRPA